jgi:hypothetical protein
MATTPSIEEKIKAAAQEKGIPPELALKIANAESANKPNAQNPRSTAGGLFQIIDRSWKDYKGAPGKKYDVDENIRVGTDIIADNQNRMQKLLNRAPSYSEVYAAHFFGPKTAKTVITASPDTPTEKILSPKVLAANPKLQGKTAADVLALMDKKVGPAVAPPMMAKAPPNTAVAVAPAAAAGAAKAPVAAPVKKVAQAAPAPTPAPAPAAAAAAAAAAAPSTDLKARIADLGPNYHAAMALAYLSDNTDEDDPTIQDYRERRDEEAQTRSLFDEQAPVAISDVDLKVRSPFPEPVMAATGGLIHRAKGSPPEGENSYFQDPMGVADSGPITADTRAPSKAPSAKSMLDMVKEVGSGAARNVRNMAIGAADLPYDVVGMPVDVATMAMRPLGYKVEKPVGGSDWLKEKSTALGVRVPESKDERDQGFRLAGEIGAGFVNPTSAARTTGRAAEMLAKLPAAAVQEATRPMSPMQRQLGIVRMPGGEFPTKGPGSKEVGERSSYKSNLDEALDYSIGYTQKTIDRSPAAKESGEATINFIDTKLRNWLTKQAGSVSDPVRESLITGKIKLPKDSKIEEDFPQALLDAARKGDTTAMKLIENKYDNMIGIGALKKVPDTITSQETTALREQYLRDILKSMKDNPSTIPDSMLLRLVNQDVAAMSPQEAAQKVAIIRGKLAENPNWFNTVLEPKIQRMTSTQSFYMPRAVKESELTSDPKSYLALTQSEKTMSGQAPAIDLLGTYPPNFFGLGVLELRDAAMQIPPKDLARMGVPEFLSKAIQINKAGDEALKATKTVEKAIEAGRAIPSSAATYGTRELLPKDTQGYQWREVVDPNAVNIQAAMLDNSIASYSIPGTYGSAKSGVHALTNGDVRIFSLYSPQGHAVSNVEFVTPKYKGKETTPNSMPQFTGNGLKTKNANPVNYAPQIRDLINFIKPDVVDTRATSVLQNSGLIHDIHPDALKTQFPQRRAMGGAVERQSYDNRRYL